MSFMAMAMLYYGLILFKLQSCSKIKDKEMEMDGIKISKIIVKLDQLMLVTYCIVFGIYNAGYFMWFYM